MPATSRSPISKPNSPATLLQRKQKMSLSQTYFLAHTARGKLSKEAARADHDLRLLVGHANLLDDLMIDLADAEREQESWFNETLRNSTTTKAAAEPKHISWADSSLSAVSESDDEADEESDDDYDDLEFIPAHSRTATITAPATSVSSSAIADDEDDDMQDDEDSDEESLQLVRTPSRSSPPELLHESSDSDDSEDDSLPPSPPASSNERLTLPQTGFEDAKKQHQSLQRHESDFYDHGFYLPARQVVAAY